jgi:hypothetical protein
MPSSIKLPHGQLSSRLLFDFVLEGRGQQRRQAQDSCRGISLSQAIHSSDRMAAD